MTITPVALFCMLLLVFVGGVIAGAKLALLGLGYTADKAAEMNRKAREGLDTAREHLQDATRILEDASAKAEAMFDNAAEHLAVAESQREVTAILLAEAQEKLERARQN